MCQLAREGPELGGLKRTQRNKQPHSPTAENNHQPSGEKQGKDTEKMTRSQIADCVIGVVLTAAMFILPSVVVIAGIIVLPLVLTATR